MIDWKFKKFNELTLYTLYDIIQLRIEVFTVEQNCPYQDCDGDDQKAIHLLGYENSMLVAYCRIFPTDVKYNNYCSIGRVVTKKTVRKYGYGKLMMQKAITFCIENYKISIKISAQQYLEKFYTDCGFIKASYMYLEDNIPHIAMIYHID